MLKLTLKPGEYLQIGEEIKVVFSGGSANNMHILVDAPRKFNIVRSSVLKKEGRGKDFYQEKPISEEARQKIRRILKEEKEMAAAIQNRNHG